MTKVCLTAATAYHTAMHRYPVLIIDDKGLFCPAAGVHIDPWRPVDRAVITHAHSDHARAGHGHYLATPGTVAVMRQRLGPIQAQTLAFDTPLRVGGAMISLHPAGHVPGSAQVRVEVGGEVWVVSGDYKTEADGLAEPFTPVRCHTFISECTFGLPVFRWQPQARIIGDILVWWQAAADQGRAALIGAYALGKAQRILAALPDGPGPILTHGAVEDTNATLRAAGYALPAPARATGGKAPAGALILAPPAALGSPWARRLGPHDSALASGWMALRGVRRRRNLAIGFTLSDHADWDGLNTAIRATGATRVLVTHGYTAAFRRWLHEQGYDAHVLSTEYSGETLDAAPDDPAGQNAEHAPGPDPETAPRPPGPRGPA